MAEETGFDFRHGQPRMALMAHSFFYSVGIGVSFPKDKAAGYNVKLNAYRPTSAKVRNEWSCAFIPPHTFMV